MARPDPDADTPPWDGKQRVTAKSVLRRAVPWVIGLGLVAAVGMGLKPKPVEVETGLVARAPLTVRVSEEGKTRIRNRYVVAAPVNGRMRRVPLKAGDAVKAGETLLTAIEPVASPLLDPRAKLLAEAIVSSRQANVSRATEALAAAKSAQTMSTPISSASTRSAAARCPMPTAIAPKWKPRSKPPTSAARSSR